MEKVNTKNLAKVLLFIVFILFIYFIFQSEGFSLLREGDIEAFEEYLDENLFSALMLMLLFMVIQNAISMIPLVLLVSINVIVFGFWGGFLWSWVKRYFLNFK